MTDQNSLERVREYILCCIDNRENLADPWTRINAEEISVVVGISPQAVNKHVRNLLTAGDLVRERRFYFSYGPAVDVSVRFLRNQNEVSQKPYTPPQGGFSETSGVSEKPDAELQEGFSETNEVSQKPEKGFSETSEVSEKPPKWKLNENINENENENSGKVFQTCDDSGDGLRPLPGLLFTGLPKSAAEVRDWIDQDHPWTRTCYATFLRIFRHAKLERWYQSLTDRGVFGMLAALPGFLEDDLREIQSFIDAVEKSEKEYYRIEMQYRKGDKPSQCVPWAIFASRARSQFEGVGIHWPPCGPTRQELREDNAEAFREKLQQRIFPEVAAEPLFEKKEPQPVETDPVRQLLEQKLGPERFQLWFGSQEIRLLHDRVVIVAANQYAAHSIRQNFRDDIAATYGVATVDVVLFTESQGVTQNARRAAPPCPPARMAGGGGP